MPREKRDRPVCTACLRHACLECSWYRVVSRRFDGVLECPKCAGKVVKREVRHSTGATDERCGYRDVMPAIARDVVKRRCQFCERERDEEFMDFVEDEGWECRNAVRCEDAQMARELDAA